MATSVGILFRVSSSGQDEANQIPELEQHCADNGYRINKRYPVNDKSAYHGEHEAWLDEVREDIRTGVIKKLVVVHSSRLDRRDPDTAEIYLLSVKQAGGEIESVREPMFGKSDLAGDVFTVFARHSNHEYSKSLSGHVQAAHNRIRGNHALLGRAPFGYEIIGEKYNKNLQPTELGLKYVPLIFDRIIKGQSLATVADWLTSEGVPVGTSKGKPWDRKTLGQIIHNPVYKGFRSNRNGDDCGSCPAIISDAVWKAANDRLDNFPKRGPENNANKALLTSHLFCVQCKSPMYKVKTAATVLYYRCSGKNKPDGKSCFMPQMPLIDGMVDEGIAGLTVPITELVLVPGHNYEHELEAVKRQARSLDMDDPEYDDKHSALVAERKRLMALDTVPDKWERRPTGDTFASKWKSADFAGKRDMLKDMTIFVGKNDRGGFYVAIEVLDENGHEIYTHVGLSPTGRKPVIALTIEPPSNESL